MMLTGWLQQWHRLNETNTFWCWVHTVKKQMSDLINVNKRQFIIIYPPSGLKMNQLYFLKSLYFYTWYHNCIKRRFQRDILKKGVSQDILCALTVCRQVYTCFCLLHATDGSLTLSYVVSLNDGICHVHVFGPMFCKKKKKVLGIWRCIFKNGLYVHLTCFSSSH